MRTRLDVVQALNRAIPDKRCQCAAPRPQMRVTFIMSKERWPPELLSRR